jgi:hypothetical protein
MLVVWPRYWSITTGTDRYRYLGTIMYPRQFTRDSLPGRVRPSRYKKKASEEGTAEVYMLQNLEISEYPVGESAHLVQNREISEYPGGESTHLLQNRGISHNIP